MSYIMCELNKLFDDVLVDWLKEIDTYKNDIDIVVPTYLECSKNIRKLKRKRSQNEDYPEFNKYIKL